MKYIPTEEFLKECGFKNYNEDFERLKIFNWNIDTSTGYPQARINGKKERMHKVILGEFLESLCCDHIDRNKLNNQRSNLRIVTRQQNMINRAKTHGKTSKFKGVFWNSTRNKWIAGVCVFDKTHHKQFDSEIEAAKMYNEMAKKYHGEFAYLNKI